MPPTLGTVCWAEQQYLGVLLGAFLSPQDTDIAWQPSTAQYKTVLQEHEEDD